MCGICGVLDQNQPPLSEAVDAMVESLHHRGPDDRGKIFLENRTVALGHTRLSILDLSQEGHQPMTSQSKRYTVVYNGEIYNYQRLKQQYSSAQSYAWQGESDTEVLLALIEKYGFEDTLPLLDGMFAVACWDHHSKQLYLARDRMGEKPLYYGKLGSSFVFASELKAFAAYNSNALMLSPQAIEQFLQFSYVPAPLSIYKGISKLLPAHFLQIDFSNGLSVKQPKPYWRFPKRQTQINGKEAEDALSQVLQQVIKDQMLSDRPLGAFLSGGIDSSLVVAMMQQNHSQSVNTFSIGFSEQAFNEAPFAKQVADHLKTNHHQTILSLHQSCELIQKLPQIYDEPFADSSQLPTYLVCGFAKKHVTVALSGDGADECFGGYTRYSWTRKIWRMLGWLPLRVRQVFAKIFTTIPEWLLVKIVKLLPASLRFSHPKNKITKLCQILHQHNYLGIYRELVSTFINAKQYLIKSVPMQSDRLAEFYDPAQDLSDNMMYIDAQTYLPDDILVKVDRAAMAHSLETRAPFLDRRVVELSSQISLTDKIDGNQSKKILKNLLYQHVPQQLIDRPKMGFGIPVNQWLRGELRSWSTDLLSNNNAELYDILHKEKISDEFDGFYAHKHDNGHQIWALSMLFAWHANFIASTRQPIQSKQEAIVV